MYVREREEMFRKIRERCEIDNVERLDEEYQLQILIGVGLREKEREIREIVLDYMKKAYEIRKRYIK